MTPDKRNPSPRKPKPEKAKDSPQLRPESLPPKQPEESKKQSEDLGKLDVFYDDNGNKVLDGDARQPG